MSIFGRLSTVMLLALSLSGLVACNGIPGAESGDVAPQRPTSTVSGFVVDDAIGDAFINVYAFDNGVRGELLGQTKSSPDGAYEMDIQGVERRPVLIEARGGHYVELASGVEVGLGDDEVLKAVAFFQPGQPLDLMVTPFTHLVAALVEFKLAAGATVETAIETALVEVRQLFGIDVNAVYPRSISDQGLEVGLTDEHLYGFYLSALSSWTKYISSQNKSNPHSIYTSIGLSQILFNELSADGLLDGRANNKSTRATTGLALGVVELSPNVYRFSLAQHMLAMAASAANASTVTVDELLPLAFALVESQHKIFAGIAPEFIGGDVQISADENLGSYRSGVFEYAINIGSPELISSVSFSVDDKTLAVAVVPGDMRLPIDSREFADGEHSITMRAKDWLGNSIASHTSKFKFDNTAPYVNVDSNLYTNNEAYELRGSLGDNGSGIDLFKVQGQPVSVNADNSWAIDLPLTPGNNFITVDLRDLAGNEFTDEVVVVLDQTSPVIDTTNGHAEVEFSTLTGVPVSAVLADTNNDLPIHIETNKVDLDGTPITRAALTQAGIAYFSFVASDAATGQLTVEYRYEKNSAVVSEWRPLTRVDGEYLLPLASEVLGNTWHQSVPADQHAILVRVIDAANNVAEKLFMFRADFVVPEFEVDQVEDLSQSLFDNVAFADRSTLNEMSFNALAYIFSNNSGKAVYIQPLDEGGHAVQRDVEQLARENLVRMKTSTDWSIGSALNAVSFCDGSLNEIVWSLHTNPDQVLNYSAGQWLPLERPASSLGELQLVNADAPVPPAPEPWTDVSEPDADHASYALTVPQGIVSFSYDYLLSTETILPEPAMIMNWSLDKDGDNVRTCSNPRSFKQRLSYSFQSEPGYPRDKLSILTERQTFSAAGFSVMNETAAVEIVAVSGWYRVPAGHTVTISKNVMTPALTVNDDVSLLDAGTEATYTPLLYDKNISWSINREITLKAIHAAGEDNIFLMSPRQITVGAGAVEYALGR